MLTLTLNYDIVSLPFWNRPNGAQRKESEMILTQYCRLGNMFFRADLDPWYCEEPTGKHCPHCGTDILMMKVNPTVITDVEDAEDNYIIIPEETRDRVVRKIIPMVAKSFSGWTGCSSADCIGQNDPEFYFWEHNPYSEEKMRSDMARISPAHRKEQWQFFKSVRTQVLAMTTVAASLVPTNYCVCCGMKISYRGESPAQWGHMRKCAQCSETKLAVEVKYCRDCGTKADLGTWEFTCPSCTAHQRNWSAFNEWIRVRGMLKPLGTYACP